MPGQYRKSLHLQFFLLFSSVYCSKSTKFCVIYFFGFLFWEYFSTLQDNEDFMHKNTLEILQCYLVKWNLMLYFPTKIWFPQTTVHSRNKLCVNGRAISH